ncbi:uncharacterized protein LOC34619329 [Cyclospora cayetanensis]|uniref:Uncharacterized protein LOC34619329 n=1 Tax=Cyclospora cayetanensis TaxID=88456 RepID=A0A6P6RT62_9EIME|nr:uncharacterized protein LOC34619329 [Cyclospora cayetanensis]
MDGIRRGFPSAAAADSKPPAVLNCMLSVLLGAAAAAGSLARKVPFLRRCCLRRRAAAAAAEASEGVSTADLEDGGGRVLWELRSSRASAPKGVGMQMHSEGMVVSGLQLGGEGLAVADTAVEQDRCVFEVCVLTPGEIHVGVCRLPWAEELQDAQSFISGKQSWMTPLGAPDVPAVEEGDIITCAVDQSDSPAKVNLLLNGMPLPASSRSGIHGEVWPAVFIRKGATIKWAFDSSDLRHLNVLQDRGYQPLMASRNLI